MNIEMYELPDAIVSLRMRCEDCGHIQTVKGNRYDGDCYFGSSYDWCDKCDTGLPVAIEQMKVINEP